jgi:hypothetical protein
MKKRFKLTDEFDSNQIEHFTHYDYLLQLITNGQPSDFAKHIKKINNRALLHFMCIMPQISIFVTYTSDEILSRMKGE